MRTSENFSYFTLTQYEKTSVSPKYPKKYISCRNGINTYVYVFIWLSNATNAVSA